MEPAPAPLYGPGVPLPPSTTYPDTRSDTPTSPSDTPTASSSSDPVDFPPPPPQSAHHQSDTDRQLPPASPKHAASHSRSQTVDCLPSSQSPTASTSAVAAATVVRPPSGKPIKRKPLSSAASAVALRFSSSGSPLPSPLELPKPEQRFARSFSVDSPTLYEFSSAACASPLACQ